jgi:hypothetical protein
LPTVAQQKEIGNLVDIQKYLDPSLFSEITNNFGSKSLGEAMILYEAMKLIKTNNLNNYTEKEIIVHYLVIGIKLNLYDNKDNE